MPCLGTLSRARPVRGAQGGRMGISDCGAGEGNRTLVSSLGSYSSTIELHPQVRLEVYSAGKSTRKRGTFRRPVVSGRQAAMTLQGQKLPLKVANAVTSRALFWPMVVVRPKSASSPNSCVRAPISKVL